MFRGKNVLVVKHLKMEMYIQANLRMVKNMEKEEWFLLMAVNILENIEIM